MVLRSLSFVSEYTRVTKALLTNNLDVILKELVDTLIMNFKYFVGFEHQKIHSKFIKEIFPGDYVHLECTDKTLVFPDTIFEHDDKNTVWFFNDVYFHLHPRLKGKQVLVGHGTGFGRSVTPERTDCINKYIDVVFCNGFLEEQYRLEAGIEPQKLKQIGYTYPLLLPDVETNPLAVLFSSTYFKNWNHYDNLNKILDNFDSDLIGRVTIHPQTPEALKRPLIEACQKKENLSMVHSQEQLLHALSECSYGVFGGATSVAATYYLLGKPTIYVRGRVGVNPLKGIGWKRIKKLTNSSIFDEHLDEVTKISNWKKFNKHLILNSKPSEVVKKMFYPWNLNKTEITERLVACINELSKDKI